MTSTLKIYKNCKILPNKNFIVDYISTYLSDLESAITSDFQYIKHALDLEIKIDSSQLNLEFVSAFHTNYLSIENNEEENSKEVFYFIIKKKWLSSSCIKLVLSMDTLNTFKIGTDYNFGNKTLIQREHVNRFESVVSGETYTFYNRIDRMSEGINPLLYMGKIISEIRKSPNIDWYLVYRSLDVISAGTNNPFDCWIYPSESFNAKYLQPVKFGVGDLSSGESVVFLASENNLSFDNILNSSIGFKIPYSMLTGGTYTDWGIAIGYVSATQIRVGLFRCKSDDSITWDKIIDTTETIYMYGNDSLQHRLVNGVITDREDILNGTNVVDRVSYGSQLVYDIRNVNRSDNKLYKIIKLPYCPFEYENFNPTSEIMDYDNNDVSLMSDAYGGYAFKLVNRDYKFHNRIENVVIHPLSPLVMTSQPPKIMDYRRKELEPKVYHSDYYRPKFFYDSFSMSINLEEQDIQEVIDNGVLNFPIDFYNTTMVNSKILFKFTSYVVNIATEDIPNIIAVSRNNEELIYTNDYLNYLRTGYNFDEKIKSRTIATTIATTTASTFATSALIATNPYAGAVGAVATTAHTYSSIINTMQTLDNIERKRTELRYESGNISACDDVDLMSIYCDNRLKYVVYQCHRLIYEQLLDLFYYFGYKRSYYGIPSLNTRKWFNYIQCSAYLNILSNMPQEVIEDILFKFSNGVTCLHRNFDPLDPILRYYYDFEQERENWESSLF